MTFCLTSYFRAELLAAKRARMEPVPMEIRPLYLKDKMKLEMIRWGFVHCDVLLSLVGSVVCSRWCAEQ
jgi:hypothetical protein